MKEHTYHGMARTTTLYVSKHESHRMTNRRLHLRLSRTPGDCHVCGDTGIVDRGWTPPVFDEHRGHMGEVSETQLKEHVAFNRAYSGPVPCFNPSCTALKPEGCCDQCGGIGQVVVDGALTDTVCQACRGYGMADAVALREAA